MMRAWRVRVHDLGHRFNRGKRGRFRQQAAFDRLRRQARARSRKLDDLAREIIAGRRPG
jgi:ANTAR domain